MCRGRHRSDFVEEFVDSLGEVGVAIELANLFRLPDYRVLELPHRLRIVPEDPLRLRADVGYRELRFEYGLDFFFRLGFSEFLNREVPLIRLDNRYGKVVLED